MKKIEEEEGGFTILVEEGILDFPYIYGWCKIIREKERERIFRIIINSFLKIIINIPSNFRTF